MRARRPVTLFVALILGCALLQLGTLAQLPMLDGLRSSIAIAGTMPPDQTNPDTSGATPNAAAATPPASGATLASDSFSNPDGGLFRKVSTTPDTWTVGYVSGEYQISSTKPVAALTYTAFATGTYADVSVAARARLTGSSDSTAWVGVGCRYGSTPTGFNGYYLYLNPTSTVFHLYRSDAGTVFDFSGPGQTISSPPNITATHQLQITCAGSTITGSIDGKQVASVQDSAYQSGQAVMRAGISVNLLTGAANVGIVDARFGDFVLSQP